MDSVQSPGVLGTGHPGAFFLLSQMPAGVAVFQLQTELLPAVAWPFICATFKTLAHS